VGRWSRLLADRLGPVATYAVIDRGRALISRRKRRRGGRFVGGESGIGQPGHHPDKNPELDRNKIRNFQVHFATPPSSENKYDGNQREFIPSILVEILFETIWYNNLEFVGSPRTCLAT